MPILAPLPVKAAFVAPPDPMEDSRWLAFRSLDGENLLPFTGSEFIAGWGLQGMDKPANTIVEERVPGVDGTFIRDIQIGSRTVGVPLFVGSDSSHLQYLQNRALLRGLFDHRSVDYQTESGTFDLVAESVMGERALRCAYVDGMGGDWARDSSGSYWESFGLSLLACRTYWHGVPWTTEPIRLPAGMKWFGQFPPALSSSRALGAAIPVFIPGDIASWARVDLVGPATSVTVAAPGLLITIPAGLGSGEKATIVTNPRGRTALFEGVKAWSRVGPNRQWRPLSPGLATMTITMVGATTASSAVVSGETRYETPW